MNIPKAIKLLQKDLDDPGSVDIMDLNKAQELGLEALKRIKDARDFGSMATVNTLPGETKD